ncbi:hypothetical protein D9611_012578 [Ephemerocybe angulata]|uniref:alpha-galactosidase n=1 Tax=Ephemerocybe angulata TaxID=980116 RepID=A0A8H5AW86_9AGAR|nr:hypothetical protein D9611_012578 [Tulosesus angulatus]
MRSSVYIVTSLIAAAISTSGSMAVVDRRAITFPAGNSKFDYQLGGAYTPPSGTQLVVRDRTAAPAPNVYNICYINAFQTQPAESAWWKTNHDSLLLRKSDNQYFEDPEWPGEIIFDTKTAEKRAAIAAVLNGWIDSCATAGFKAIEPDNLDTYTRSKGLLSKANNLALAKLIADHAHGANLAIAQKNTAELGSEGKSTVGFDFAIVEECQAWDECDGYTSVYGARVLEIEYTDTENAQSVFKTACAARGSTLSIILRDRQLVAQGKSGYHYEEC